MKKTLRSLLVIIIIAGMVWAGLFIHNKNKMKEYSTYCMDRVRHELGEYIENIHLNDSICDEGTCVYMGGTSYEGVDYSFSCKVHNKENIELNLEPLYSEEESEVNKPEIDESEIENLSVNEDMPVAKMRVLEGQTEEETQAMIEETCGNMGGTWIDGSCMLEDGSYVNL